MHRVPNIIAAVALLIVLLSAAACAKELMVSAAASLTDACIEVGKAFEKQNPGVDVKFNFASSGTLAAQIEQGAPVDVYASASQVEMDRVEKKNLLLKGTRQNFAGSSIVVVIPRGAKLKTKSLSDLTKSSVKRIAMGDPKSVPAGRYAQESLRYAGLEDKLRKKMVYGSDVRQVRAYALRGEVDAAIVFSTDACVKGITTVYEVPEKMHSKVVYPVAVVKNADNATDAKKFISYLTSAAGQKILSKYGFTQVRK